MASSSALYPTLMLPEEHVQAARYGQRQPRIANARNPGTKVGRGPRHLLEALLHLLPGFAGANLRAHTCHRADECSRQLDLVAGRVRVEPVESLAGFPGGEVVATHAATLTTPSDIPGKGAG